MPEPHPGVATIDAFMNAEKRLLGADGPLVWRPGRSIYERILRLPIEINGELLGQSLFITGFPRERQLKFRIGIIFPPAICRIDYAANERHPNSLARPLDYVPASVRGPHYHSWRANRRFFSAPTTPIKLHNAEPLPTPGRSFDAVLRWFCNDTRIELPANHTVELPLRETLL